MSPLQKATILIVGCLAWIFALGIGLSWYTFGYLDGRTVTEMTMMLIPLLGVATFVILWSEKKATPATNPEASGCPRSESLELIQPQEKR
ncbi:MAG: hypothetical protein HYU36_06790 [Planctomycetes bacterium]|nr:hypothetical protein [Planctomycetota bacterium]